MRRVLVLFGAVVAAWGCGRSATPKAEKPPEEPRAERAFGTGKVEIVRRSEDRSIEWSVQAESADLVDAGPGRLGGRLQGVTGSLFKGRAVSSRFTSDTGEADQASNRLVLEGRVRVVARDPDAILTADRIVYRGGRQLIEATGNVRVDAGSYQLGPLPSIWATPDLRTVGTPDRFKTESGTGPKKPGAADVPS